ncbi:MAG: STAS domain-containing protein [Acidobacteriaceae bacterium]
MPLSATIESLPDRVSVVTLTGSMTLGSSLKMVDAQVQQALAGGVTALVFDLTGVDYSDSAGLGLLVYTQGLMQEKGGQFRLCGLSPRVLSLLEMTRTNTFLSIDPAREESLAALRLQ